MAGTYFTNRCAQPAQHNARATDVCHQQPSLLRLRLACSVLRPDGHNGRHVLADGAAPTQEGAVRGGAPGV